MTLFKKVGGKRVALTPSELENYETLQEATKSTQAEDSARLVRDMRNNLLTQSDWTQLKDTGLDSDSESAWATYRQELRDLPEQAGFPDNVVYPTQP
jgi:hypothetical protein